MLGEDTWDLVVDTWDGAPRVATEAAQVLRGRAPHYGYVSSSGQHPRRRGSQAAGAVVGARFGSARLILVPTPVAVGARAEGTPTFRAGPLGRMAGSL